MVKGEYADRAVGKTKELVGKATKDRDLEAEGKLQKTRGRAKGLVRKVKGALP